MKPYADVSFQYIQGSNHIRNELHLMNFEDKYDLSSNGSVNITAKIMSHGSEKANVHVVLIDSNGREVYSKKDIQIDPMQTYDLSLTANNLQPGKYDLVISSIIDGASIWQKDLKIDLIDPSSDNDGGDVDLSNAAISIDSNTKFGFIDHRGKARPFRPNRFNMLPPLGMHPGGQLTLVPWNKAKTRSYGNSDLVKCPLPTSATDNVTYEVTGNLNHITCKIKK